MPASMLPAPDWRRTPAGRRAISFALAVAIHLLLLFLLLRLAPPIERRPPPGGPTSIFTVPLAPAPEPTAQPASRQQRAARTAPATARAPAPRQPPPVLPRQAEAAQPWVLNPELAGFNLAPGKARAPAQVAEADADGGRAGGAGGGGGSSVGRGRSGQPLYAAQWVREPTDAEMAPYMPAGRYAGGWADIACRTVDRFRVEDCEELGQSPPGSGLSRALREASFQFLVRPPRVGGKTLVGEWVRIHFDFVERKRD